MKHMATHEAIIMHGLTKTFTSYRRGEGFTAAIKSLWRREKVVTHAVKDISFRIAQGEIVGFVGQNGAGKSTTIKMLSGILHPTRGIARVLGYTPWEERKKYVRHIGVVLGQKSQLWQDLPPVDAFRLMQGIYRIPEKDYQERLSELVDMLKIKEVMHRPTRNLSLGERMKCELVVALLHGPEILFLDEPTIGVDALAKEHIREFLKALNKKRNVTIILTTHDMDDIEELCERVIMIDKGVVVYDGALATMKEKYITTKTIAFDYARVKDKRSFTAALRLGKVLEDRDTYKELEIARTKVPKAVEGLLRSCDIIDLAIHEPRLENVIKEIYKEQQ